MWDVRCKQSSCLPTCRTLPSSHLSTRPPPFWLPCLFPFSYSSLSHNAGSSAGRAHPGANRIVKSESDILELLDKCSRMFGSLPHGNELNFSCCLPVITCSRPFVCKAAYLYQSQPAKAACNACVQYITYARTYTRKHNQPNQLSRLPHLPPPISRS